MESSFSNRSEYQTFCFRLINMLSEDIETSMTWTLLDNVEIHLALDGRIDVFISEGPIRSLFQRYCDGSLPFEQAYLLFKDKIKKLILEYYFKEN